MKKYYFIVLLTLVAMVCNATVQVTLQINEKGKKAQCLLSTPDTTYRLKPDSLGRVVVTLDKNASAGYGTLYYGFQRLPLYFNSKSFELTITPDEKNLNPVFTGQNSEINTYLNTFPLLHWMPDYKPDEAGFAVVLDQEEKMLKENLASRKLEKEFTQLENKRLHYFVQGRLGLYPLFHKRAIKDTIIPEPTDVHYNGLRKLLVEDESLLILPDYYLALSSAVNFLGARNHLKDPALDQLKLKLDFVEQNLKNPAIISHLVAQMISSYVERSGMEGQDYFVPIYNAKVLDVKAKKEFNDLCAKWAAIAPGQPCPAFSYPDIDGKAVSLADLAGKYVYIDIWASWCAPCRAEFPALKELEEKYKDKDICFVGLSGDARKADWEKVVREEQLAGIQLHMSRDQALMQAYMIEGIPHFILLDKEGKIIYSKMSRPSNKQTTEILDELLN